jgi:hypothetical protein
MLTHIRICVYVSTHMQMQWSITGDWTQLSMPGICKSSEFSTAIWSSKSVATSHTCDIQHVVCNRIHLQSPSVQASKTLVATLQLYFISWSWHRSRFCWPLDIPHPSVFWQEWPNMVGESHPLSRSLSIIVLPNSKRHQCHCSIPLLPCTLKKKLSGLYNSCTCFIHCKY